jgi:hypothetical protein
MLSATSARRCVAFRCFALGGALYFVLALLVPLLSAYGAESKVPLCCRRSGLHHCAGLARMGDGPAVSDANRCSQWPRAVAAQHRQEFSAQAGLALRAGAGADAMLRLRNAETSQMARERQFALRGPPVSVA